MTATHGKHRCDNKYCNTCNEMVPFDHRFYFKVVQDKSKKNKIRHSEDSNVTLSDENSLFFDIMDDEIEEVQESSCGNVTKKKCKKQDVTRYIFFDFECTQDDGTHEPNVCVADMVCEVCANIALPDYQCKHCTPRKVFKGSDTKSNFCDWLFQSPQTDNSVALAHYAKGYDSYFLLNYLFENACVPGVVYSGAKVMSIDIPQ